LTSSARLTRKRSSPANRGSGTSDRRTTLALAVPGPLHIDLRSPADPLGSRLPSVMKPSKRRRCLSVRRHVSAPAMFLGVLTS
jgi:hypothetical protein